MAEWVHADLGPGRVFDCRVGADLGSCCADRFPLAKHRGDRALGCAGCNFCSSLLVHAKVGVSERSCRLVADHWASVVGCLDCGVGGLGRVHTDHPRVVVLVGRNVQAQLRKFAGLQLFVWQAILGRLLFALASAVGQGVGRLGFGGDGRDRLVGVDRAQVVNHAVVFVLGDLAFLQVADCGLEGFRALEAAGRIVAHPACCRVLLVCPYGVLRPARLAPSLNVASSALSNALALARASISLAGVIRGRGRLVDDVADAACLEFFVGCIFQFLLQTLALDDGDGVKRGNHGTVRAA